MTITESWASIDQWLARHAPATHAVLAPPATDADLSVMALPPELVESLRCHNGLTAWASILPEAPPSSAAEIAANWQLRMELSDDYDGFTVHPPNTEPYWHPSWIPWADSDGDLQIIDLRPGPTHGRLAMAYHDSTADFTDSWPNLTAYLEAIVQSLHTGTAVNGWYPYLTTHQELWWDRGPDKTSVNDEPLVPAFRSDG
ncbi:MULTISPECIES: SMI1/KNR4 family protein [unclassified Kribbella]|uniref:SMI1/KNR4 family protein n=1 Tax=unclassified Kribbella TaxID=2644121 RepID=UPI003018B56E